MLQRQKIVNGIYTIALATAVVLGVSMVQASWSNPTQAPIGNNAPAPLNVSASTQEKDGALSVGALMSRGDTVLGGTSSTTASSYNVTIGGLLKILSGTPGAGKVLTSDASGNATWQSPKADTGSLLPGALCGSLDTHGTTVKINCAGYDLSSATASEQCPAGYERQRILIIDNSPVYSCVKQAITQSLTCNMSPTNPKVNQPVTFSLVGNVNNSDVFWDFNPTGIGIPADQYTSSSPITVTFTRTGNGRGVKGTLVGGQYTGTADCGSFNVRN